MSAYETPSNGTGGDTRWFSCSRPTPSVCPKQNAQKCTRNAICHIQLYIIVTSHSWA